MSPDDKWWHHSASWIVTSSYSSYATDTDTLHSLTHSLTRTHARMRETWTWSDAQSRDSKFRSVRVSRSVWLSVWLSVTPRAGACVVSQSAARHFFSWSCLPATVTSTASLRYTTAACCCCCCWDATSRLSWWGDWWLLRRWWVVLVRTVVDGVMASSRQLISETSSARLHGWSRDYQDQATKQTGIETNTTDGRLASSK